MSPARVRVFDQENAQEEDALKLTCHLARGFEALLAAGVAERELFSQVLRGTLLGNPTYLGFWAVFEPDALGGPDICFADAAGHDPMGRFMPYWNRGDGSLRLDAVTGLDEGTTWYSVPKESLQLCTAEPYLYPVAGRARWIQSALAPVACRGKCVGVIGTDWETEPGGSVESRDPSAAIVHVNGEAEAADRLRALTARQREVYFWLTQGKSNEEISIILEISAHTVKNHVDRIFQKLGVGNRLAAALISQRSA